MQNSFPSELLLTLCTASAIPALSGCATKAAYTDLANEQDHCAGYWRHAGDPDKAQELSRRSIESRRAADEVSSRDDFLGELFVLILAGGKSQPRIEKQAPHTSDARSCE